MAPEESREERNVEMWKSHSVLVFPAALNGEEHNIKTHLKKKIFKWKYKLCVFNQHKGIQSVMRYL